MTHLLEASNRYGKTFTWQRMSLFKLCCIAFGVMLGILIPEKWRKQLFFFSAATFILSYIPLMMGFINSILQDSQED